MLRVHLLFIEIKGGVCFSKWKGATKRSRSFDTKASGICTGPRWLRCHFPRDVISFDATQDLVRIRDGAVCTFISLSLAPLLISEILPKIYCYRFLLREALCDDRWDPVKKWLFKPLHQLTRLLNKQSCCYWWQKNCFGVMVFAAWRWCLIGSSHTGRLVSRMFTATDCLLTLQVSDLLKRQPLANHIMSRPSDSSQTKAPSLLHFICMA